MEVKFVEDSGEVHTVTASPGSTAMEAAIQNGVPGIDGDCGGNAACGTCHIRVSAEWLTVLDAEKSEHEEAMLELIEGVQANSRLACQITLEEKMNGIVLHLPEEQF